MAPSTAVPLPDRPEAITADWLDETLDGSLDGVEVAGVRIVDQHSGTTGRARLALDYASGSVGPATVFVKLPPFREDQRGLVAAGVDAPDLEDLLQRLRLAVLYGWVAATATASMGDRWQPIEVGMSAMRDATRTCAELETLEAFRDAL